MRHSPRPLLSTLCALAGALLLPGPARALTADHRLGHEAVPTFQAIRLGLDADSARYEGRVRIELRVDAPTDSFQLHAKELDLGRLALRGSRGAIAATHAVDSHDVLTVRTGAPLEAGRYTLEIEFANDFNTSANSLYRLTVEGRGYSFTQFQSKAAREAFPCFDEPEFKIPWQVTLEVPREHAAVSNTPVQRDSARGARHVVVFERTPPLPSYLLAIATGPLESVPIPGMSVPGRVWTVKGRSHLAVEAVRWTPPLLKALEKYFGSRHPYPKLDLLAVPEFWAGAMENPGAITFREERLLLDPGAVTPAQRSRLVTTNAHEIAHMWFGDLVTLKWWDDIWLNESFASWMGNKVSHQVAPELEVPIEQALDVQRPMRSDAQPSTHAIHQSIDGFGAMDEAFDAITYDKGEAVLGMIEQWIGPETFRKGVRAYIAAHEHGSATSDDLWAALTKASGSDVVGAARSFIEQAGVPLVEVEPLGGGKVRLSQRRLMNLGVAESGRARWRIPLTLRWSSGDAPQSRTLLFEDSTLTLDLGADPTWLYPNAEAMSYFRFALPSAWVATLAASATRVLTPRERVALAGNVPALVAAGRTHGDQALRLIGAFGSDPQPQVVTTAIEGLTGLRFALVPATLANAYAAYVRKSFGPALERIGPSPVPGEPQTVTVLRPRLVRQLGDDGRDPAVLARARTLCDAYLANSSAVDPSLVEAVLELAAIRGDSTLWDTFRRRFEQAELPVDRARFLNAVMSFRDPALVAKNLAYSLSGALRPQEAGTVMRAIGSAPENEGVLFEFVKRDWDRVTANLPPFARSFLAMTCAGCSRERLEEGRAFFMQQERRGPGTERMLARVADIVHDCASLREREGAAVERWLTEMAGGR